MLREQEPPSEPPPTSALEQVERAERRLEERSAVRGVERERILARRARWDRWRLPLRVLGLGVAGAVVFLVTLQAAGGDLSDLPGPLATLIVVVELVAPGAIAARLTRAEGWPVAVSLGVCVFAIELALVFGVGLLLLGLGPE